MAPITSKPSKVAETSWWEWLNFTTGKYLVDIALERRITLEDFGGIEEHEKKELMSKQIEDLYYSQPESNRSIFWSVVKVFKSKFAFLTALVVVSRTRDMMIPILCRWLAEFATSADAEYSQGLWLVFWLLASQMLEYLLNETMHILNHTLRVDATSSVSALILRKAVRMSEATSKNYDSGQI